MFCRIVGSASGIAIRQPFNLANGNGNFESGTPIVERIISIEEYQEDMEVILPIIILFLRIFK